MPIPLALRGDLRRSADGHLAAVHGLLELGRTLHLDGMVVIHCILNLARHLRDLLADPSTLGRIRPKVIRGGRSRGATGPRAGHRFRLPCQTLWPAVLRG